MSNLLPKWRVSWTSVSLVLMGTALWFGCSDSTQTPVAPDADLNRSQQATDRLQEVDLTPAMRAQERHGAALMRIPGVVGHGVGVDDDGNPTITVFTIQSSVSGIPARLDDIPTRTVVSGQFVAGALTARVRPADNGFSIGHPDITAGTLGAVVKDGGGVCHVLSNNHVLAASNEANLGDSALQPGPFDGGSDPNDAIGTLFDFEPIAFDGSTNTIDAAIAEIFTPVGDFVSAKTPDFTPTSTPVGASVGQDVKKTGRTTELTTGDVTEVSVSVNVCYECAGPFCFSCKKVAHFENQIATTDMSDGGDSGSLIVDTGNNPVGLLFAGSDTRTIANPISDVLTRFSATVIQPTDLSSCTNGGSTGDSPPSVSITDPSEGATVSGSVTVSADASDDNGVNQVEFFIDGGSIGTDTDGSNGWSATWITDSGSYPDGDYTVTAEATDTANQTASDAVNVTVDNVDDPPSVSITNPAEDATVSGSVTVSADASDDNGVNQVEFFIDGGSIGTDTDGSNGWSATWITDSGSYPDGDYTVTAEATDTANQTASDAVNVTVNNTAPSIALTATGYKVRGLQKADLEWSNATSTNVDVFRDGTLITTTTNDGLFTDNIDQRGPGNYTYQVCEAGTSTCSNEATVTF